MNVSTKSEYGLRALIYLAGKSQQESVPAREIAQKWNVPVKYLEQILKTLKEAGLVTAQVGVSGGYRLTRAPSLITAGEVIRVLDGRVAPMGCVSTYWIRTRAAIMGVIDETTIADLCTPPKQTVVNIKSVSRR